MNAPLTSWKKTLKRLGYRVIWDNVLKNKRRKLKPHANDPTSLNVETLEPRQMLSSVPGIDVIENEDGSIDIFGTDQADVLEFDATSVVLNSSETFEIDVENATSVRVFAFAGDDTVRVVGPLTTPFEFYGGDGDDNLRGGAGPNIIFGDAGDDAIAGGNSNDQLSGGDGNDTIMGKLGNDRIVGGPGSDLIYGNDNSTRRDVYGADDDVIVGGPGNDALFGNEGDDRYVFEGDQSLGSDYVQEVLGQGNDTLDFGGLELESGVSINLSAFGITQDVVGESGTFSIRLGAKSGNGQIENVVGTKFDDEIVGNQSANRLEGRLGNDMLAGGGGDDHLIGNEGDDTLDGDIANLDSLASVQLEGGFGDDTYVISTPDGTGGIEITINDSGGSDTLDFSAVQHRVEVDLTNESLPNAVAELSIQTAESTPLPENLVGTDFGDRLVGNTFVNEIRGGDGNDEIFGDSNDVLLGEGGLDSLEVLDQADAAFANSTGAWQSGVVEGGFNGEQLVVDSPGNVGDQEASWNFNDLEPGDYEVYVTWQPDADDLESGGTFAATNAFFVVEALNSATQLVNQRVLPQGPTVAGRAWQKITGDSPYFSVDQDNPLQVRLQNHAADGFVIADAVRIVKYNHAPELQAIGNQSVDVGQHLSVDIIATDQGAPADELVFELSGNSPAGLEIAPHPTQAGQAILSWPVEDRPVGTFHVTVQVSDQGTPALTASETIAIQVGPDSNVAPQIIGVLNVSNDVQFDGVSSFTLDEGVELGFDLVAFDSGSLTYSLSPDAPEGAAIDAAGRFSWTPTEQQDSRDPYVFELRVTDDGNPPLRSSLEIEVVVSELNNAPIVSQLELIWDTGENDDDLATINPSIRGVVSNDNGFDNLEVLIDASNDGEYGQKARVVPLEDGSGDAEFFFEPSFIEVFANQFGQGIGDDFVITAVAREADETGGTDFIDGDSVEFEFTFDRDENQLPQMELSLRGDNGGETLASTNPTIDGVVSHPDGDVNELVVYVYDAHPGDSNAVLVGTVDTDSLGEFEFKIDGLTSNEGLLDYYLVVEEETLVGSFQSEPQLFRFEYLVNEAPVIVSMQLVHDSGESATDGVTSQTAVEGLISHADGELGGIIIEFDDNNDGTADGVARTRDDGTFSYQPSEATTGTIPSGVLKAQAIELDEYHDVLLRGNEYFVGLTYDVSANAAPGLVEIDLLYPNSGDPVSDPTLFGYVANDGALDRVVVEFSYVDPASVDFDRQTLVVGATVADADGRFEFTPTAIETGVVHTIYARPVEWDPTQEQGQELVFDNQEVQSISFMISDSPVALDFFAGIQLAFDTGSNNGDEITSDPTIVGNLEFNGDASRLVIEFDHTGNGQVDGAVSPESDGSFQYVPAGLFAGSLASIRARVRVPDFGYRPDELEDDSFNEDDYLEGYSGGTWDTTDSDGDGTPDFVQAWFDDLFNEDRDGFEGDWYNSDFERDWSGIFNDFLTDWSEDLEFTFDPSVNQAATIDEISLVNDSPGTQFDPTFGGAVQNDGNVEGLLVEIFLNGSQTADGSTITNAEGDFVFTPSGHWVGTNQVLIRVSESVYNSSIPVVWDSGPFNLKVNSAPDLGFSSFELKNNLGDVESPRSIDSTLVGQVEVSDNPSTLPVLIDYNGDGIADAFTTTDGDGRFEFTPVGMVVDPTDSTSTVRVQVVELFDDEENGTQYNRLSDWQTFSWEVLENEPPQLLTYELLFDSGQSAGDWDVLDRVTVDPTVVGRVSNDDGAGFLTIEFDHDGDGIVDGSATTNSNGQFEYTPEGLTPGGWNIRARVLEKSGNPPTSLGETIRENGYYTVGGFASFVGWSQITQDGNPETESEFYGFTLVGATGGDSLSLEHSGNPTDPTLSGTISDVDGTANIQVEFYLGSDFVGSTNVNADGTFEFTPQGISFGNNLFMIAVQTEWDYATGSKLTSSVNTITFDFTQSEHLWVVDFQESAQDNPFDPTLEGVVNFTDENVQPIHVEVEIDNVIGEPIHLSQEIEEELGETTGFRFQFLPDVAPSSNPTTVRVRPVGSRAIYQDEEFLGTELIFGDWASYQLTYDLIQPSINEGWEIEDDHTSSPTITGTVSAPTTTQGNVEQPPVIEFDYDGDGLAEETVVVDDSDSTTYDFAYTFAYLAHGSVEMQARVIRFEAIESSTSESDEGSVRVEVIEGEWQTIAFELQNPAPEILVESLVLLSEEGDEEIPETTDPTITGSIASVATEDLSGISIQADFNNDGFVDDSAVTLEDGTFVVLPENLEPGENTVRLRAVDSYSQDEPLYGEWVEFTFVLLELETPVIGGLELVTDENPDGDSETDQPVITGTVSVNEAYTNVTIQFDHDNDGRPDGIAIADASGAFVYSPEALSYGQNTIRARAIAESGAESTAGEWLEPGDENYEESSITFFYASTELPVVTDLRVEDAATGEITGRITVDGYGVGALVKVNVLSGGTLGENGFTYADEYGYFSYQPGELVTGTVELEIQGVFLVTGGANIEGDPQTVTFEYAPESLPNTLPVINSFDLLFDTGSVADDFVTSDTRVGGQLDFYLSGTEVEFSIDSGAKSIGVVPVGPDGSFEFFVADLEDGESVTVHARRRVWDPDTGVYETTGWDDEVTFVFNQDADQQATIVDMQVLYPSDYRQSSGRTPRTYDPTLRGTINNDGDLGGLLVEFDHNNDGIADGQTVTRDDGTFVYRAHGLEADAEHTIRAFVAEMDPNGIRSEFAPPFAFTFLLIASPIVENLEFAPDAGTAGAVTGDVEDFIGVNYGSIQYQVVGNLAGEPFPTELTDYEPSEQSETLPVGSTGSFTIDLAAYSLGPGSAGVFVRAYNGKTNARGPWEFLSFEISAENSTPQDITSLQLLEDTGDLSDDQNTSNPTVKGVVGSEGSGAFALVELTWEDTDDQNNPNLQVARVTADRFGYFEFTPDNLEVGYEYVVEARHVLYDPATQQEQVGNPTSHSFVFLDNNNLATITGFGLKNTDGPTVDPTLIGQVIDDGGVIGLRIEYDSNNDEEVDGFAFTDAEGKFEFTLYNIPAGQETTVRVRVVEWDGVEQDFVSPDFAEAGSNATATFTLDEQGPTDAEFGDDYAANQSSFESADANALDAVNSYASHLEIDGGTDGQLDIGIGSYEVQHQANGDELEDTSELTSPNIIFNAEQPTQNVSVNEQMVVIDGFVTSLGGTISSHGGNDSYYTYIKEITVDGDTVTTYLFYELYVANYSSSSVVNGFETRITSYEMTSRYTFEYFSVVTYTPDGINGYHTLSEEITYDFIESTTVHSPTINAIYVVTGDQTYEYHEAESSIANGNLTQDFSVTVTSRAEVRSDEFIHETILESNGHTNYVAFSSVKAWFDGTFSNSGTIVVVNGVQTVSGNILATASASATATLHLTASYHRQSPTFSSNGSLLIQSTAVVEGNLRINASYVTGDFVSGNYSLGQKQIFFATQAGNGARSYSSANGNSSRQTGWRFNSSTRYNSIDSVTGTFSENHNGFVVRNYSFNSNRIGLFSSSGSSSTTLGYWSNNGNGHSSSGTGRSNTTYSSSSNLVGAAVGAGHEDLNGNHQYGLMFTGRNSASSNFTTQSSGNSQSSTPTRSTQSAFQRVQRGESSGNGTFVYSESHLAINATSNYNGNFEGSLIYAAQSHGTEQVPNWSGGTNTVAFRYNVASEGMSQTDIAIGVSYRAQKLGLQFIENSKVDIALGVIGASESKTTQYTEIAGDYIGYALSKVQSSSEFDATSNVTILNGEVSARGNNSRTTETNSEFVSSTERERTVGNTTTVSTSFLARGSQLNDSVLGFFELQNGQRTATSNGTLQRDVQTLSKSTQTTETTIDDPANHRSGFRATAGSSDRTSEASESGNWTEVTVDGEVTNRATNFNGGSQSRYQVTSNAIEFLEVDAPTRLSFTTSSSSSVEQGQQNSASQSQSSYDGVQTTRVSEGQSAVDSLSENESSTFTASIDWEGNTEIEFSYSTRENTSSSSGVTASQRESTGNQFVMERDHTNTQDGEVYTTSGQSKLILADRYTTFTSTSYANDSYSIRTAEGTEHRYTGGFETETYATESSQSNATVTRERSSNQDNPQSNQFRWDNSFSESTSSSDVASESWQTKSNTGRQSDSTTSVSTGRDAESYGSSGGVSWSADDVTTRLNIQVRTTEGNQNSSKTVVQDVSYANGTTVESDPEIEESSTEKSVSNTVTFRFASEDNPESYERTSSLSDSTNTFIVTDSSGSGQESSHVETGTQVTLTASSFLSLAENTSFRNRNFGDSRSQEVLSINGDKYQLSRTNHSYNAASHSGRTYTEGGPSIGNQTVRYSRLTQTTNSDSFNSSHEIDGNDLVIGGEFSNNKSKLRTIDYNRSFRQSGGPERIRANVSSIHVSASSVTESGGYFDDDDGARVTTGFYEEGSNARAVTYSTSSSNSCDDVFGIGVVCTINHTDEVRSSGGGRHVMGNYDDGGGEEHVLSQTRFIRSRSESNTTNVLTDGSTSYGWSVSAKSKSSSLSGTTGGEFILSVSYNTGSEEYLYLGGYTDCSRPHNTPALAASTNAENQTTNRNVNQTQQASGPTGDKGYQSPTWAGSKALLQYGYDNTVGVVISVADGSLVETLNGRATQIVENVTGEEWTGSVRDWVGFGLAHAFEVAPFASGIYTIVTGKDTATQEVLDSNAYWSNAFLTIGEFAAGAGKIAKLAKLSKAARLARANKATRFARGKKSVPDTQAPKGARGPATDWDGFDEKLAGGPVRNLNTSRVKIANNGIDAVERHLSRFGPDKANEVMVQRLRDIADGKIAATAQDLNFYTHELRESVRYRRLGWKSGLPDDIDDAATNLWRQTHTATLDDYNLPLQRDDLLYHPDALQYLYD